MMIFVFHWVRLGFDMADTLSARIQKSPAEEIPQGFLFVRLVCDSFATRYAARSRPAHRPPAGVKLERD
jgi:hypothetical protein